MTTATSSASSRDAQIAELLTALLSLMRSEPEPEVSKPVAIQPAQTLLTVAEAAKRLGIGRTTAYALVQSGDLESVLIGRLRRIHVDSIAAYAAKLVRESNGGARDGS